MKKRNMASEIIGEFARYSKDAPNQPYSVRLNGKFFCSHYTADLYEEDNVVMDRPPVEERLKLEPPPNYAVVMLDDDFTPMDFVVMVLTRLFNKTLDEAEAIMMDVHEKGKAWAGCYTREIAETRVAQVHDIAQAGVVDEPAEET